MLLWQADILLLAEQARPCKTMPSDCSYLQTAANITSFDLQVTARLGPLASQLLADAHDLIRAQASKVASKVFRSLHVTQAYCKHRLKIDGSLLQQINNT